MFTTNTRIDYIYRDADNYKFPYWAVVEGEISEKQIEEIIMCLDEETYFIPQMVGLPCEYSEGYGFAYDPQSDHKFCELGYFNFSGTNTGATVAVTIDELVERFKAASKNQWKEEDTAMLWKIPVRWEMKGIQAVRAPTLENAMRAVCNSFDVCNGEFIDGSLELDCCDVEAVRSIYNNGMPDNIESAFPELMYYDDKFELDISCDLAEQGTEQFRIVFDIFGTLYYCNVTAKSKYEALGAFLLNHPHVTYDMIVDCFRRRN